MTDHIQQYNEEGSGATSSFTILIWMILAASIYILTGALWAYHDPETRPSWILDVVHMDQRSTSDKTRSGQIEGQVIETELDVKDVTVPSSKEQPPVAKIRPEVRTPLTRFMLGRVIALGLTNDACEVNATFLVKVEVDDPHSLNQYGIIRPVELFEKMVEPLLTRSMGEVLSHYSIEELVKDPAARHKLATTVATTDFSKLVDGVHIRSIEMEGFRLPAHVTAIFNQLANAKYLIILAEAEKEMAIKKAMVKVENIKAERMLNRAKEEMITERALKQTETDIAIWTMKKKAGMPVSDKP